MKKTFFLILLFIAKSSAAQPKEGFPYLGGLSSLEKDINKIFVEANDSGRIFFVEISYSRIDKKIISLVHGAAENNPTKVLLKNFFQQCIFKWKKKYLKKTSVVIPLFIEGIDPLKLSVLNTINLSLQTSKISESFDYKNCILTKPLLIKKSEFSFDLEQ